LFLPIYSLKASIPRFFALDNLTFREFLFFAVDIYIKIVVSVQPDSTKGVLTMKAYLQHNKKSAPLSQQGGPFHGHKLRLTVGMIVKNEEKNLEKCLQALQPLLDAVPSELIITDTGSTDKTVEIAKKYTSRILHFDWCGDFSAARNTGLFAAQGEWFFYLDADEWLDDATPLIEFFNSGECDEYWSAGIAVRSYNNLEGTSHQDVFTSRLHRMRPGISFENKIHEDIVRVLPTKIIPVFAHHYGYAYRNPEEKNRKYDRNLSLLRAELQEDPDNMKALIQISGQMIDVDNEQAIQYAKHGMEVARRIDPENQNHLYARCGCCLLQAYFQGSLYAKLLEELPDVLSLETVPGYFHLECYMLAQTSAWRLKRYEDTIKYGRLFLKLYEDHQAEKIDSRLLFLGSFHCLSEIARENAIAFNGQALVELEKTQEALNCLKELGPAIENYEKNGALALCFAICEKRNDWSAAIDFYQKLLNSDDRAKIDGFTAAVNNYCFLHPSQRDALLRAAAAAEGESAWLLACRLMLAKEGGDRASAAQILAALRLLEEKWDFRTADVLWYLLTEKINVVPYLARIDTDDMSLIAAELKKHHEDYAEVLRGYVEAFSFENPKALFLLCCLLEFAVRSLKVENHAECFGALFEAYMDCSSKYVRAVYRPEALATVLSALPGGFRFAYYAGAALEARRLGKDTEYISSLGSALKEYPAMKDGIHFLLTRFEEEQRTRDLKAQEFAALAKQVKHNIEQLIAQGDLEQAGTYTLQLAKLIPEDDDIRRYRKLTHTEPTMNELAANLPQ
jgi:glycosyltransferase involved in cell wall biosynthesis